MVASPAVVEYSVPDAIEPVIAYRAFRAGDFTGYLRSVHMLDHWFDPSKQEYVATCETPFYETLRPVRVPHEVAVSGHTHRCGFYAKDDLLAAQQYARCHGADILARVKLSGKVIPGDTGWRAEKMQIDAIYDWGAGTAAHAAVLYGVPLIPFPFPTDPADEALQDLWRQARAAHLVAGGHRAPAQRRKGWFILSMYGAYLAITFANVAAQLGFHLYSVSTYWVVFIAVTLAMNAYTILHWKRG